MVPLLVGSALAVLGLLYVLVPLFRGADVAGTGAERVSSPDESSAIDALREIEFDQATGKLSPEDYAALRASYVPRALAELRARDAAVLVPASSGSAAPAQPRSNTIDAVGAADAAERLIARLQLRPTACPTCGPRPEADALFCSDCGRYLVGSCLRCGATAESPDARYCEECGVALAA